MVLTMWKVIVQIRKIDTQAESKTVVKEFHTQQEAIKYQTTFIDNFKEHADTYDVVSIVWEE